MLIFPIVSWQCVSSVFLSEEVFISPLLLFRISLLGIEFLVNRFKFVCLLLAYMDFHKRPILILIFVKLCVVFNLLSLAAFKVFTFSFQQLGSNRTRAFTCLLFCLFILFNVFSVLLGFEVWCLSLILEISQPLSRLLCAPLFWLPVC